MNKEEEKKEGNVETYVVEQLPQVPQREVITEDNKTTIKLITRDEALTEILNIVREIKRSVA